MTEEVKKLIESVESFVQVRKGEHQECVLKSDFYRVVEKLTKWNKVEDKLPDSNIELDCICMRENGKTELRCFYTISNSNIAHYFDEHKYAEWKYIY